MSDKFWKWRIVLLLAFVVIIAIYSLKIEAEHVTYSTPQQTTQPTIAPTAEPTLQPTAGQPIKIISLGEFRYTYYTNSYADCKKTDGITFSGTRAIENLTVAVDTRIIPLGSFLFLENVGFAVAQDIGSAVKGNLIDIYYEGKVEDPQEFGQVFILNRGVK